MKRVWKQIAVLLMAALAALPALAAADTAEEKTAIETSKTAENLTLQGSDYISDVKLSIPSEEERLTTDVVFILDKSSFSDTAPTALQLLGTLKDHVSGTGAKVNVGIVQFNRTGHPSDWMDLETQYADIEELFTKKQSGGTNMHAGLLAAKELLASDTETPDSRKYFILVSDGDTYLFCKNGDYTVPYSRAYTPFASANRNAYGGFYDTSYYQPNSYSDVNKTRPTTPDAAAWDEYLADVAARNQESNGDSYDFKWLYYDEAWSSNPDLAQQTYVEQPRVKRSASNSDMAYYYAVQVYKELAGKYHGFASAAPSLSVDGGKSALMKYLNGGTDASFDEIQNELLYLVSEGSRVEDTMGYVDGQYNFDLYNPDSMTVTLSGTKSETYKAEKLGDNHWGFGSADGKPLYEVQYTPASNGTEKLVWTFNTSVTNFDRVSLDYKVKLMNPKTEAGTYGTYDRDGSKGYDELFTNNSAVLYPVNSQGKEGTPAEFPKPTVSYTIKKQDPGPSGNKFRFTFTKVWQGEKADGITWTLYNADGAVVSKKFNKKVTDEYTWNYETWFRDDAGYYLVEEVPDGYAATYKNVGSYADVTDRCYSGGTIINTKIPKTGDTSRPLVWLALAFAALGGTVLITRKKSEKSF